MGIPVTCVCGQSYNLKEQFAGQMLRCPKCNSEIQVPQIADFAPPPPPPLPTYASAQQTAPTTSFASVEAEPLAQPDFATTAAAPPRRPPDPVFNRDKFLLRQKAIAISAKYFVWDERGQTIMFIVRPAHLFRNLLAAFAGIGAGFGFMILMIFAATAAGADFLFAIGILGAFVVGFIVGIRLYRKRHVTFYRNEQKQGKLLEVYQDQKVQILTATYQVMDDQGELLARLKKVYIYNIFRKRWYCYKPDGTLWCVAKEDSIILSLLRRFLGTLFGFLRTNFVILEGNTDKVIGEFNRKFTLLDRYVLDMSRDHPPRLDRRVALALGVMLDTGERR